MEQVAGVKRNYQRMMEQVHAFAPALDGVAYHDFSQTGYYTPPPPPPHTVLFSNPFPSPHSEYPPSEGYLPSSDATVSFFPSNRSLSEPFIHNGNESFSSASSSCGGPATPPPVPQAFGPITHKYPAVPITPSHAQPRQKAKRTATACEECRKRKQKCDGETPCQSCKEQKLDCKYREVSPTKKDNSLEKLIQLVETCQKSMDALNQRLDTMGSTLIQIETRLSRCWQCGSNVPLETGTCHNCPHNGGRPCR